MDHALDHAVLAHRRASTSTVLSCLLLAALATAGCGDDATPSTDAGDAIADASSGGDSSIPPSDAGDRPRDAGGFDAAYPPVLGGNTLWIGNSLVRFHASGPYAAYDVPAVVQELQAATGRGSRQEMRVLAQDGFDLHGWWTTWYGYTRDGMFVSAARAIVEDGAAARTYDPALMFTALPAGQRWNRIVLLASVYQFVEAQEHWYGSVDAAAVIPNLDRWVEYIRSIDPSIEILHYEGPVDGRIMSRQPDVDAVYADILSRWGGRLVPVGPAFARAVTARPDLELRRVLDNDFVHYSHPGIYLASCVFFAVLYGDPVGLPVPSSLDVNATDAAFLQGIARDAVAAAGSGAR